MKATTCLQRLTTASGLALTVCAVAVLCALLPSCSGDRAEGIGPMRHAALLSMEEGRGYTLFSIRDPWDSTRTMARYVLVPRDSALPPALPGGTLVRTPVERAVVTTSVHLALWDELCGGRGVAGATDTAYIVSPRTKEMIRRQGIASLGSSMNPDIELLKSVRPDVVLISPYEQMTGQATDRVGAVQIWCADYMEISPLGRAEWVRFFGRLMGEAARADSLFETVEGAYEAQKNAVKRQKKAARPTVVCDMPSGQAWYQPGGRSTMGRIVADAGGAYLWADRTESGSLSLGIEAVAARAADADVWLVKYGQAAALTYDAMAADCQAARHFEAWKERRVWACNTMKTPFYEEEPFHPERLLADLIAIFADPDARPARPLHFYRPLE